MVEVCPTFLLITLAMGGFMQGFFTWEPFGRAGTAVCSCKPSVALLQSQAICAPTKSLYCYNTNHLGVAVS